MKTREEHIAALSKRLSIDSARIAIEYAEGNGMPVAPHWVEPEPVHPVVGELLSVATLLLHGMAVVGADGLIWQYRFILFYAADRKALGVSPRDLHGARIVYVPGGES